jgi:hypothetical protein
MDPVQNFLQSNALEPPAFAPTSRYYGIATTRLTLPDGRTVVYVQRRCLPPTENFAPLHSVTIAADDRLDNIAARYIGDPQQSWRLCDANGAMLPEALVAYVGSMLTITLPEGVPAPGVADGQ